MTLKCTCAYGDLGDEIQGEDICPIHDWSRIKEIPDRREELREREIRRGMRMTSWRKEKRQEF